MYKWLAFVWNGTEISSLIALMQTCSKFAINARRKVSCLSLPWYIWGGVCLACLMDSRWSWSLFPENVNSFTLYSGLTGAWKTGWFVSNCIAIGVGEASNCCGVVDSKDILLRWVVHVDTTPVVSFTRSAMWCPILWKLASPSRRRSPTAVFDFQNSNPIKNWSSEG